jgi:SAM-dependent methyltransferase
MSSPALYLQVLSAPPFPTADVRRYYDANTDAFVRHGQGGGLGAIHRAVWGPGVADRDHAFRYVDDLVLRQLDTLSLPGDVHVLDLGCGVGGSLTYLARQRPIRGTGITLSPVQAALARERVTALGLSERIEILEGDYTALPPHLRQISLAYAIESFVHGPSPGRFLAEAARVLAPGGVLVICDDVRTVPDDPTAAPTISQFARGWHVNSLLTAGALQEYAAGAGFVHVATADLTPYLELARPRDRAIAMLAGVVGRLPRVPRRLAPLIGGAALQRGLRRGWIAYHCAVFRRA